jgi:hypothetical protein
VGLAAARRRHDRGIGREARVRASIAPGACFVAPSGDGALGPVEVPVAVSGALAASVGRSGPRLAGAPLNGSFLSAALPRSVIDAACRHGQA